MHHLPSSTGEADKWSLLAAAGQKVRKRNCWQAGAPKSPSLLRKWTARSEISGSAAVTIPSVAFLSRSGPPVLYLSDHNSRHSVNQLRTTEGKGWLRTTAAARHGWDSDCLVFGSGQHYAAEPRRLWGSARRTRVNPYLRLFRALYIDGCGSAVRDVRQRGPSDGA